MTSVSINLNPSNLGANLSELDVDAFAGFEQFSSFFFKLSSLRREIRTLEEELVVLVEEMEAVAAAAAEAEAAKSPGRVQHSTA